MDSQELNERIYELDASGEYEIEAFGGKVIPYIGWFWRTVNFDHEGSYFFGVIPAGQDDNSENLVGFMERNKWGYPYVVASPEQWKGIKRLIAEAVLEPTAQGFEKVYAAIQALG